MPTETPASVKATFRRLASIGSEGAPAARINEDLRSLGRVVAPDRGPAAATLVMLMSVRRDEGRRARLDAPHRQPPVPAAAVDE